MSGANDVGNLALSRGINSLAVFNPAFAPEIIDDQQTNCVKLERREQGLSTKFRLSNVPRYWSNDYLYRVGIKGLDLDALKAQASKEFVAIGLDTNEVPVRTWLYTIAVAPDELSDLMARPESYFAAIPRDTISFTLFDPADPDNPDAFPGQSGYFNWLMPPNPDLFPSFSILGWSDADWNWNDFEIDNPAWYGPGDCHAWTSDTYLPGATATYVREAGFNIWIRNANAKHYRTQRRYDRWADDFIAIENGEPVLDVDYAYAPENLKNQIRAKARNRDTRTGRLETTIVVEGAYANGADALAETDVSIGFQPHEHYGNGDRDYIGVYARIRYENNQLFLVGFVWGSNNEDGSDDFSVRPSGGNFPFGHLLNFNQSYTLAVEYFESTNQLVVEFDDGQGLGPCQSAFDMDAYPVFDPKHFQFAEIRTRIRNINQPGDSAGMRVRCDDVYVKEVLYDDFNNGFGINKWWVQANE